MAIFHLAVRHAHRRQGRSALAHVQSLTRAGAAPRRRAGDQCVHVEHRHMPPWAQANPRAFWAVRVRQALDGGEHPYVLLMVSERTHDGIERARARFFRRANPDAPAQGGAAKDPVWRQRDKVAELREAWAETANQALERAGLAARIDHRSLAAQGLDRTPEPKLGPERTALLRRGIATPQAVQVLALRQDRAALVRIEQEVAHLQARRRARGGGER